MEKQPSKFTGILRMLYNIQNVNENRAIPPLLHILQMLGDHPELQWLLHGLVQTVYRRTE
jgi:hypothetical protein